MFISDLATADSLPALEATLRYAGRRQRFIANNIANIDTPNFVPTDAPPEDFQKALGEAIDRRRARFGGTRGELEFRSNNTIQPSRGPARFELKPKSSSDNILFHDRNNRDVERMMQDLSENFSAFQIASTLLRSRADLLNSAIAERI